MEVAILLQTEEPLSLHINMEGGVAHTDTVPQRLERSGAFCSPTSTWPQTVPLNGGSVSNTCVCHV